MRMKSRRTLAILLSMVLLLALAPSGFAVNLELGANTVTVNLATTESGYADDLKTVRIHADFYLLAPAISANNDDSYTYDVPKEGEEGYPSSFQLPLEELMTKLADDPDLEKQNDKDKVYSTFEPLAQEFASIVLSDSFMDSPTWSNSAVEGQVTVTATGLNPGLYLLIIHGSNLTKSEDPETGYIKKTEQDGTEKKIYTTRVVTEDYEYLYQPQLLTVPTKVSDDNVQQYNTAYGNWVNQLSIYAKPTRESRNGELKIIKNLKTAGPDRVTFVFEVSWPAKSSNQTTKVVSMTFDGGQTYEEYILADTIPIGMEVEVKEVHSGIAYTAEVAEQTATIVATPLKTGETGTADSADSTKIAEVVFTNDHSGPGGGHGILNRFTAGETGAFTWEQFSDSPAAVKPTAANEG